MADGVAYIRFFGDDWLSGTSDLSLEERGALITIVALTAAVGGPVVCDYTRLARRFGCTKSKAQKIVGSLIAVGKLSVVDGYLHNARAVQETKNSQELSKKQTKNAYQRWAKSEGKFNKNNEDDHATALPPDMPTITRTITRTNNYNTGAGASASGSSGLEAKISDMLNAAGVADLSQTLKAMPRAAVLEFKPWAAHKPKTALVNDLERRKANPITSNEPNHGKHNGA